MDRPIRIFVSYSHADEAFKDELLKHLSLLRREKKIAPWTDRDIVPGEEWEPAIFDRLDSAGLVLLLVSADFLASDFCYEREMKRAVARHEHGETTVVPVIVRPCDWGSAPFAKIQGLPKDAQPISTWDNRDLAWLDVVKGLRRVLAEDRRPSRERSGRKCRIQLDRLPVPGREFFGRDEEIAMLDRAWAVRKQKLESFGREVSDERPDHWWSFQLTSR